MVVGAVDGRADHAPGGIDARGGLHVDDLVALAATGEALRARVVGALHEDLHFATDEGTQMRPLEERDLREERLDALVFHGLGDVIAHRQRRRVGARRVLETERRHEARFAHQRERLLEVMVGLAREADDQIRGEREARTRRLQRCDAIEKVGARVAARHAAQHRVGAALDGEVNVRWENAKVGVGRDEIVGEVSRVWRGVAEPEQIRDLEGDAAKQASERALARRRLAARLVVRARGVEPRVDRLSEQCHLAHAAGDHVRHLGDDLVLRSVAFGAACVGHHAIRAALVATLHHRHVGGHLGSTTRTRGEEVGVLQVEDGARLRGRSSVGLT